MFYKRIDLNLLPRWIFLLVLLFLSKSTNFAIAQTPIVSRAPQSNSFLEGLKLTHDQQKQITSIRNKYKEAIKSKSKQLRTLKTELRQLMVGSASLEQIRNKYTEQKHLKEELEDLRFNSMLEIHQVLTVSQRTQLFQLMQKKYQKYEKSYKNHQTD